MTVHVLPTRRQIATARADGRERTRLRAERLELWLVAALIAATAAQAALCAWFWLG